jgi:UDP-3-O-[3-hydroxymyristoyl] N-acetylglucosamine deacetylase
MEMPMNKQTIKQRTLRQAVSFVGLGLHSGKKTRMTLRPCDDASGIFFRRKDVPTSRSLIAARWHRVSSTNLSTGLSNSHDVSISTVEHLMAALRLCGIDNLEIEVDGPEIPIMDGSAMPFVETLGSIGTREIDTPRKAIWIHKPVEVRDGERYALLMPDNRPRVTVSIDFSEPAIGAQTLSVITDDPELRQSIAPARTFGFLHEVEQLRERGLALGGSLNNAILVDGERVVNPEGLRFADEFVRHKVLDAIGDLSLIGAPLMGHYHAFKSGHLMNKLLIYKLLTDRSAWSLIGMNELQQLQDMETPSGNDSADREARHHAATGMRNGSTDH